MAEPTPGDGQITDAVTPTDGDGEGVERKILIMYGTLTCPMVPPVRGMLDRAGVDYEYVDIGRDMAGKQVVREINNGYESVPTLVFPDGRSLTEPSLSELKATLNEMGYDVPTSNWLQRLREGGIMTLIGAGMIIFGLIDGGNFVFIGAGIGLLIYVVFLWRI